MVAATVRGIGPAPQLSIRPAFLACAEAAAELGLWKQRQKGGVYVNLSYCPQLATLNTGSAVKCAPRNLAVWPFASLLFLASHFHPYP